MADLLVARDAAFTITRSRPHGHVAAVLGTLRQLGVERLLAAPRSPERDRAVALLVSRALAPDSKLAAARALDAQSATSTLGELLGLGAAEAEDLYDALDLHVRPIHHRLEERARMCSSACSPTTSSGTCERPWRRCSSPRMTRKARPAAGALR